MNIFEAIWSRITDEPAFTLALVQAALALFVGFGLQLTPEQMALILAFTAALLGWITRSQVTPTKYVEPGD